MAFSEGHGWFSWYTHIAQCRVGRTKMAIVGTVSSPGYRTRDLRNHSATEIPIFKLKYTYENQFNNNLLLDTHQ